jgi:DNA-binding NarL/FixJ family response regulator
VAGLRIAILADDLIWATRLATLVRATGADPVAARSMAALGTALAGGVERVIVDLTARGYDGVKAIAAAVGAGAAVLAVGQHDDVALRRRALEAGASRFVPYRLLAEASGPAIVVRWAGTAGADREAPAADPAGADREAVGP